MITVIQWLHLALWILYIGFSGIGEFYSIIMTLYYIESCRYISILDGIGPRNDVVLNLHETPKY